MLETRTFVMIRKFGIHKFRIRRTFRGKRTFIMKRKRGKEVPEKIKISKSKVTDAEEILRLQYAAYQSEAVLNNDFTIQPLTQTIDELRAEYETRIVLKATLDNKIIGSVRAYAEGDTVYIGKLIVHPDHQGKGLGKRLLAMIESKFLNKRYELHTSQKSERNLHIYEKAGYKRFKEETSDSGLTFIYLEKKPDNGANMSIGLSLGICIGAAFGIITGNMGLWLSIGLAIGIAIGSAMSLANKKSDANSK